MANAKVNYTVEMTSRAKEMYSDGREAGKDNAVLMQEIATALGRSVKSVRAKLVREGAYVVEEKPVKVIVDTGPSKAELLETLAELGFVTEGIEGATKAALTRVIDLATQVA